MVGTQKSQIKVSESWFLLEALRDNRFHAWQLLATLASWLGEAWLQPLSQSPGGLPFGVSIFLSFL